MNIETLSAIIEARIRDEQRKHPSLDWIKIASKKIAGTLLEHFNMIHSIHCKDPTKELGHICYNCHILFPSCRISRLDLPGAEGTGCDVCYPKEESL